VEIHSSVVVRLEVSLRVVDIDAIADPVDYKIAEGAVANDVVAWASDTNSLAATVQNAVGHRYSFADRWLFQHGLNGADNDAIIAGLQKAVADGNIPAGVNVDAVIVDHLLVAKHLDTVNVDFFAGYQPHGPAGRIHKRGVFHFDVPAFIKEDHAGTGDFRLVVEALVGRNIGIIKGRPGSVDSPGPGDGYIFNT
jgi:hypothetical protein